MARNSRPPQVVTDESQEELTVVIFKLKGGSGTLQKGFDAINTAFASFGSALPAAPAKRLAGGPTNRDQGFVAPTAEVEEPTSEDDADLEGEVIETTTKTGGNSKPKGAPRSKPKFIDSFDLKQSDKPWKEFATDKVPKTDYDKYLLASLWITENAGLPEFTVAHIFTCFRAMSWPEQVDFSQPMRFLKSKKSYYTNPESKKWKLTGPGLDAARSIKAA